MTFYSNYFGDRFKLPIICNAKQLFQTSHLFKMNAFITPERVITEPTAPGAPARIQRMNSNQVCYSINLYADMCDASGSTRPTDSLMFPEMDEDDDYQEHYTLPEDQLYGDEDEDLPHPNVTLFRGSNPAYSDSDSELDLGEEIQTPSDFEQPEVQTPSDFEQPEVQEQKKEIQKNQCGPAFKFVEMDYRETQGIYPKRCAMCTDSIKYANVYETSCEHTLCCDCYNNHEDASAARCEILRSGFLSCPVRSCRKTIKTVTGYKRRKGENLFLSDGPMVYCKETGYWVPDRSKSK